MAMTIPETKAPAAEKSSRVRLDYLDGLRGLAALYVVLNHTSIMSMALAGDGHGIPRWMIKLHHFVHFYLFNYGVYAVAIFIVLSGYCLMLPIAQSPDEVLRGGIWNFAKRRFRRIGPPYYAALALCLASFGIAPLLHIDTAAMCWHKLAEPAFGWGNVLSHLLLLHAWTPWVHRLDPPMWSVSVEWCIYFFFALLLLPVFKKGGSLAVLALAFAIGLGPHCLGYKRFDDSHPWFLGLFALGMVGAVINFSTRPAERLLRDRLPWGPLSLVFTGMLVVLTSLQRASFQHIKAIHWLTPESWGTQWPFEVLVGLASVCLIVYCTRALTEGTSQPMAIRVLNARPVVALGVFSYSIYLIHDPVVELVWLALKQTHVSTAISVPLMYLGAIPFAVGIAYLFHRAFERPFLSGHYRRVVRDLETPSFEYSAASKAVGDSSEKAAAAAAE
jgi:peptidoglycan/LPS O-acetylase OafA/YrhL